MKNKKLGLHADKLVGIVCICLVILAVTSNITTVFSQNANSDSIKIGDLDSDSKITLKDASLGLRYSLGIEKADTEIIVKKADINCDGKITLSDVSKLLKVALGIEKFDLEPEVTDTPTETTIVPEKTVAPTPEATVSPSVSTSPAVTAVPTITPPPEKNRKLAQVEGVLENVVTGYGVEVLELNGASYNEEKNIYTFTKTEQGIKFKNPFAKKSYLHEKITDVISTEAAVGCVSVWSLEGASITGHNQLDINEVDRRTYNYFDDDITYTIPEWNKGVSISFWAKLEEDERQKPLIVFENDDYIISMWADGSVYFRDGEMKNNMLDNTSDNILGEFGQWNYYTLTIANDWMTVYVNGQENLFDTLWISRKIIGGFNDGFLTRYNFVTDLTKEMVESDERGYYLLSNAWNTETEMYHDNFSIFGNHRFRGCQAMGKLMIDYIIDENTNMWIGGTETSVGDKYTKHDYEQSVSVADIKVYEKELTAKEVASNYKYNTVKPE